MDFKLKAALQKQGSVARALNESMLSNPFYLPAACPGATGENVAEWLEKVDAWDVGWHAETRPVNTPSQ